ncbi:pyridoxal phosphate-dependent aminotransferase [Atopobacter sp. AH10]|uniref:MalY/PatB family protein n=1 Tax=Atopobacter sp. AH10 TaxID=2315861 RepID=UPI000EF1D558|nr:MalY/PatB family protein [Atopobacter sp. AH10]RLK63494.1 pyridoxal phosphate-dependent aminotransferase [Atopobacter sp. AH10]
MEEKEFLDKYLTDRRNTSCLKWDYLNTRYGEKDLWPMWVADMEFKSPDGVIEALKRRVDHGVFGYSFCWDSYYEAYSNWMEENFNYPIKSDWVRTSVGVVPALYWFIHCFTEEEDGVLIMPPVYYPFHQCITDTNRKKVLVDLIHQDNQYAIDYAKVEEKIQEEKVKLLIFCSPHNPASRVWKEEELDRLFAICQRHGVLIVSDEIHQDFTFNGHQHTPAPRVHDGKYKDQIILVNAASKTFNLAGLVHSNIVIENEELRLQFDDYQKSHVPMEVNILGHLATEEAYRHGKDWLKALKGVIWSNYLYLKESIERELPEVKVADLQGTYLPMIDLSHLIDTEGDEKVIVNNMPVPKKLKHFVQDKCRLAVDYGAWFGDAYQGYIRFNLATDPQIVKKVVDTLISQAKELKA